KLAFRPVAGNSYAFSGARFPCGRRLIYRTMLDSEETLVQRAKAGDRAAFEDLVRRVSRLVFARLYLETGNTHQAEDLLQETLLRAFRSLHELADPRGFRTWLLKIAQNTAIDAARNRLRQKRAAVVQ